MALCLSCNDLARDYKKQMKHSICEHIGSTGYRQPTLVIISVGSDPASLSYITGKMRDCREVGIECRTISLPSHVSVDEVADHIDACNRDISVDGIILQLPLDGDCADKADKLCNMILPSKDVDCLTDVNMGHLLKTGGLDGCMTPCTPQGICDLLEYTGGIVTGAKVAIIGRSNLVGRPLAAMLLARDAVPTVLHSKVDYDKIKEVCLASDIIVVAVGQVRYLISDMVNEDSVVIDVGINKVDGQKGVYGDVSPLVYEKVRAYSPVPGGIGLLTRVNLLKNVCKAWRGSICD